MAKKLLLTTRGARSFCYNYKHSLTRWSLTRPPEWVSIEINKSARQSNIQWRGWSDATAVPFDKSNTLEAQKRVSREERRAMVESFVKKYREMNAGKFPTISNTIKQVGGSHYFVKKIVQQLGYESQMNSSNIMDGNSAVKELVNESKPLTETVSVSSGKTETTIDEHVQNEPQYLDDKEIVNVGHEEKGEPQTSRSLSDEAVTATVSVSHFTTADCNHMVRDAEESSLSSLEILNDVKTAVAESIYSDSVATENQLLTEQIEQSAASFNETSGNTYRKAQIHGSEYVDMERFVDEPVKSSLQMPNVSEKSDRNNAQAQSRDPQFVDMEKDAEEPSLSILQISNEVKAGSHSLTEELERSPASCNDKSGDSHGKAQSDNYEFVDVENHPVTNKKFIEKAEHGRREQAALEGLPGVDSAKHTMEHSQWSSILDENKRGNSNNEGEDLVVPKRSTLWRNLKSFADGVANLLRKL
ncbi:hypothetical protein L6164_008208 [Bauhinia variegata]|uniref:Uncharacterized protein n=1 Tax=Bauhinia variegata TaxID=167791 RepID=A0ACB9PFY2_BAUVA|nr:hypothetical protein L6164_008208 [Bauhinia variegata]